MSSSHLRHCPKHRKPLPCAHCALTAKPINPTWRVGPAVDVDEPPTNAVEVAIKVVELAASKPLPVDPLPVTARARPGRPRKYASAAEKQEAYRERKAQSEQEERRRSLIARILKRHRGMLSDPFHQTGLSSSLVERVQISNKEYMRKLRAHLDAMTLEEIETYAETLFANADRKGRLQSESSGGEAPGANSRVENVQAARLSADRHKPKKGRGADIFERKDSEGTPYTKKTLAAAQKGASVADEDYALTEKDLASEALKELALDAIAPGGQCSVCGLHDLQHIRQFYRDGERRKEFIQMLKDLNDKSPMPDFDRTLIVEEGKVRENTHHKEMWKQMQRLRKEKLDADVPEPGQESRLGRKLARLGRKATQALNEEERQRTEKLAAQENWGTSQRTRSWT